MILVTLFLSAVVGHNWINCPARSQFASTVNPTIPSQTGEPHAQVAPGQMFQVEWVVGHDGDGYFVLLKNDANAMKNMIMHKTSLLEDYLNNAPVGQANVTTAGTKWQKYHRKYNNFSGNVSDSKNDGFLSRCIRFGQPGYLARPVAFQGSFSGAPAAAQRNQTLIAHCLYKFPQPGVDSDRRAEYKNPKYPWIISAAKYRYFADQPGRGDYAEFAFPADTPPGSYMLHWSWRGYYDVIDIEVVSTGPVALPYGAAPQPRVVGQPSKYRRLDHCGFLGATPAGNCVQMISDAQSCQVQCDKQTDFACNAIQVFPAVMPPTVYKRLVNVSLIIDGPTCPKANIATRTAKYTTQICQPLAQRIKNTAVPEDSYTITSDPEDPLFYSTCLFRVKPSTLATPPPPPPPRLPVWNFYTGCTECDVAAMSVHEHYLPVWNVTSQCIDCDRDGPKNVPTPPNYGLAPGWTNTANASCRALDDAMKIAAGDYTCVNATTCEIGLRPPGGPGNTDVSERDCYQLAKASTRCSRTVYRRLNIDLPYSCTCWSNNPCCGACLQSRSNSMRLYTLEKDPPFV